jgi:Pathogenicity locus
VDKQEMDTIKKFQVIPGVGKSLSQDLVDLGYQEVEELQGENPEKMYQDLSSLRGQHIDRCVLYVFRCAVYFADNSTHDPVLLKWWNWKDKSGQTDQ